MSALNINSNIIYIKLITKCSIISDIIFPLWKFSFYVKAHTDISQIKKLSMQYNFLIFVKECLSLKSRHYHYHIICIFKFTIDLKLYYP